MDALRFLSQIEKARWYGGQVVHVETLGARAAVFAELECSLPEALQQALAAVGIERFYSHQARAVDLVRQARDVVLASGTASGKSLCYQVPVAEALLEKDSATALLLFPTKALAQDQLRNFQLLAGQHPALKERVKAATYDGDTPQHHRRQVRETASVVLSNPDMLHASILPAHARWARFLANLRYIVVDELHSYRGIFGSNVANVFRRLLRLCEFYGSRPQFVACSATIANPKELAEQLTGRQVELIEEDGSPRGTKYFVLWNPPLVNEELGLRRSANSEAQRLLSGLMREGVQSITFTRARVLAELVYRYTVQALEEDSPRLAEKLRPYRGGYLASERREIERQLFSGELLGVTATSALELGIDVGGLDACLLLGFPGTFASTWQQAGRAGRSSEESLAIFIATNDPIDQFLVRHPEFLFGQSVEQAVIDPDNVYILIHHLMCAAAEMPLKPEDARFFGPMAEGLFDILAEEGTLKRIDRKWYWSSSEIPSSRFGLRTLSDDTYTISAIAGGSIEVIGQVDAHRAFEVVHAEAVYLHSGDSYLIREMDIEAKSVTAEKLETDYYTQPMVVSQTRVEDPEETRPCRGLNLFFGEAAVTRKVTGFRRIKYFTFENLGTSSLELPDRTLETRALWITFPSELLEKIRQADWLDLPRQSRVYAALGGLRNALLAVLPMSVMCERQDVGGVLNSSVLDRPAIFIYDRYPGGLGFSHRGYEMMEEVLDACFQLVDECGCEDGCPACVSRPSLPGSIQETVSEEDQWAESKAATLLLLHLVRLEGEG